MSEHEFWKDLGNIFDAVLNYQKKNVEFNNRFINPWIRLGNVFDHEDQANTAVEAYKRATELDPDSAPNWAELGDAQFKKGAYDDAVAAYQKSVALDPEAGWPLGNLALTMVTQGKIEDAIPMYLNSIELLTETKDKAICWNRLGNAYRKLNDYENAFFAFQQADQLDGDNTGFNDKLDEVQSNTSVIAPEEILEQMIVEQSLEEASAESTESAPEIAAQLEAELESMQLTRMETADGLIALAPNIEMQVEEIVAAEDETPMLLVEAEMEAPVSEVVLEDEISPLDLHEKGFDLVKIVEEVIAKVEEKFSAKENVQVVEEVFAQEVEAVAEAIQAVDAVAETNEEAAPEVESVSSEAVELEVVSEEAAQEVEVVAEIAEEVVQATDTVAEIDEEPVPVAETVASEAIEFEVGSGEVAQEVEAVAEIAEEVVQAADNTVAEIDEEPAPVAETVAEITEEAVAETNEVEIVASEVAELGVISEEVAQAVEAVELGATSEETAQEAEAVAATTEEPCSDGETLVENEESEESEEQHVSKDTSRRVPAWLIVTNKVLEKLGLEEKSQSVDETEVQESAQVEAVMTLSDLPQDAVVSESVSSMDVVETYTNLLAAHLMEEANLTEASVPEIADPAEGQNDAVAESYLASESVSTEEVSLIITDEQVTELAYEEYLKDVVEPMQVLTDHVDDIQGETPLTKVSKNGEVRIAMDTKNAHVWNELGNVYLNAGSCDDAISSYSKAIDLDRHFAWPYSNLAFAYVHKGRFAEAILLYQRSIELFSTDKDKAITWNRLGNVYRRINDYSNAIAAYQTADELDPENTTLSLRTSFGLLGNMQSDSKPAYVA